MTRIDTLKSLQARIREATGADRRLDEDVFLAFLPQDKWRVDMNGRLPALTSDPDGLGACVGLMRETLPGKNAHVFMGKWSRVTITREEGREKTLHEMNIGVGERSDRNVCLSFCEAICAALIAEEEAKLTDASQNTDTQGK